MEAECLKPSLHIGDRRSSYCCRALGKKVDTVATPGGGRHRHRCRAARCGGTVAMPEVVEEAACSVRRRGRRRPRPQEEGGSRTLVWSLSIVVTNLLLACGLLAPLYRAIRKARAL
jgi:hypothetical protein